MIDREKVIRHITAELCIARTCKKDFASVDIDMLSDALDLLKEPERTGHWEGPECSSCHGILIGNVFSRPRYCPYCGAHMVKNS